MTTRGAARAILAFCSLVPLVAAALLGAGARTAGAQTRSVALTLLAQTPWTSLDDPETRVVESELRLAVVATNTGQARIGDLDVAITFGSAFVSRFQFETALTQGETPSAFTTSVPFAGRLEPGTARTFKVQLDMATVPAVSGDDSRVYPTMVQFRSSGEPVGSLFTPAIHIVREPEQPLRLAWWTQMGAPVAFDPQGRLVDPALEASVSPGGPLDRQLAALGGLTDARGPTADIDLVIEPALLEQVERMAAGYRRVDGTTVPAGEGPSGAAGAFLAQLRTVAGAQEVQVSGQPFAGPSIPALLGSGLESELARQEDAAVRTLDRSLHVAPAATVARPPGGLLDDPSLARFAKRGVTAVLADADEIERQNVGELQFAPYATATMATTSGPTTLVLPDPATQGLFSRADLLADPVRASQIVLAQLAVIWKEEPNPPPQPDGTLTVRGVAVAPPSTLPSAMWEPLLERIANAPFLTPTHAQDFVADVSPVGPSAVLRAPDTRAFTADYATDVLSLRRDTGAYTSMLTEPSPVPGRLRTDLLYATSLEYLEPNEPGGRPWLEDVARVTGAAFRGTTPTVEQLFTFTSREGTIPLRMGDPGPTPLRVTVRLLSSQFEFPDGDRQEVVLEGPDQIVSFDVIAKAAGRNPIQVQVIAPSGEVISQQEITVASTALNGIALVITLAAAGGLVLLYWRRRVRRKAQAA